MEEFAKERGSIFQEKYRVPPVEYREVEKSIDQLDIILNALYESKDNLDFNELKYKILGLNLSISDFDLQLAIDKLMLDKYVINVKTGSSEVDSYCITYHGRLFLRKARYSFTRNRPYRRQELIECLRTFYTVAKTFAAIAYSLIVVYLAYWGVSVNDKANRLENARKDSEQLYSRQIDSLTQMLSDTTRLKR